MTERLLSPVNVKPLPAAQWPRRRYTYVLFNLLNDASATFSAVTPKRL